MTLCWGFVSLVGEGCAVGNFFVCVLLGFGIFWGLGVFVFSFPLEQ